ARETAVATPRIEPERVAASEVLCDRLAHERVDTPAADLDLLARRAAAGEDDQRLEQLGRADDAEEAVLRAIEIVVELRAPVRLMREEIARLSHTVGERSSDVLQAEAEEPRVERQLRR